MLNAAAAAFKLTNIQVAGRKRRLVTILVFLLPVVLSLLVRNFGPSNHVEAYASIVSGVLAMFLVPFVAVFWGSALLTDEVEGKTLVFLWTRPVGRARLFIMKYIALLVWLVALAAGVTMLTYFTMNLPWPGGNQISGLFTADIQMAMWDIRALFFGGAAYAALAFFFATMFKKALTFALIYVYTWDGVATFLPGFLRRLSIRHHILSLTSHPQAEKPNELLQLLSAVETTEMQAMMSLGCAAIGLVLLGSFVLRNKEYLGDDPARGQ